MSIQMKPLGIVIEAVKEYGLEVTYNYEDLVFVEHNHFLLQFGNDTTSIFFSANSEETKEFSEEAFAKLKKLIEARELRLIYRGTYTMTEDENEELKIEFQE